MAFSYDLASGDADTVLISKVRLEIGDTVENSGVLPNGGNLQDEEIAVKLAEFDDHIGQTVMAICGLLARRWATLADVAVGPRRESLSQVASRWQSLAGGEDAGSSYTAYVVGVDREDGYSVYADG